MIPLSAIDSALPILPTSVCQGEQFNVHSLDHQHCSTTKLFANSYFSFPCLQMGSSQDSAIKNHVDDTIWQQWSIISPRGGQRSCLVSWQWPICINLSKTSENAVDVRHAQKKKAPLHINNHQITVTYSSKFLDTSVCSSLKWKISSVHIIKKANQRLYFFRQVKKLSVSCRLLVHIFTSVIDNILACSVTVWYGGMDSFTLKRLQRLVNNELTVISQNYWKAEFNFTRSTRPDYCQTGSIKKLLLTVNKNPYIYPNKHRIVTNYLKKFKREDYSL